MATLVMPYAQVTAGAAAEKHVFPEVTAGASNTLVAELYVQPAPGNYGNIHVYDVATNIILKSLYPPPANGKSEEWILKAGDGEEDGIDPSRYGVLFDHAGDKWNAYAVVR